MNNQIVGNAGLYYICYKLSLLGWNIMPTSRNTRGIDIIAYNEDCSHFIGVQAKTLSKRAPVPLGNNLEKVMGDWWVIVNNICTEPRTYVMLPAEVKKVAHRGEKDGRISYWLQPSAYEHPEFTEAWHRIKLK